MAKCQRGGQLIQLSMTTQVFVTINSLKIHTPSACLGQIKKRRADSNCPAQHKRGLKPANGLTVVPSSLSVNFRAEG